MDLSPLVRAATLADAAAVQNLYAHHVLHGFGTFEEIPPSLEEMAGRIASVIADGLPWRVVEVGGRVVAFSYATPFRPRTAYRLTVEDSVYVAPEAFGRGYGRAALSALIDACRRLGKRSMCAVIGDSGNAASIGLHTALGFQRTGVLYEVGFKHGRFLDIVFMQLNLVPEAGPRI